MSIPVPAHAMILAAGPGKRLRPYTEETPKPLLPVAGKAMIDWVLDILGQSGVKAIVVNSFYGTQKLQQHLQQRAFPKIQFVIEEELLGTGGAIRNALPLLGEHPFFILHSNVIWISNGSPALQRLADYWDSDKMDALALVVDKTKLPWFKGKGDYLVEDSDYRLQRVMAGSDAPLLSAGIYLVHPRLFENLEDGVYPLNIALDEAQRNGRLYGLLHKGEWYSVNTVQDYATVNKLLGG